MSVPIQPPLPKKKVSVYAWILITCALLYILYPLYYSARQSAKAVTTVTNAKRIALAHLMYAADNDDRLCRAEDWERALLPMLKYEEVFWDPSSEPPKVYGFGMNDGVAAAKLEWADAPQSTVLLFSSNQPRPSAHGGETSVRAIDGRPLFAFVDGSIKRPKAPTNYVWKVSKPGR